MQHDELKKLQSEVTESARALETSVRKEYESARAVVETPAQAAAAEVDSVVGQLNASLAEPAPVPAAQAAPVAMDAAVPPAAPVEAAGKSAA
jgi:sec-independent protein translocase protein TatB